MDAASLSQHVVCSTLLWPSLEHVSLAIMHLLGNKRVRKDRQTPTVPINELNSLLSEEQVYKICLLDLYRHLHLEMLASFSSKDKFDDSNSLYASGLVIFVSKYSWYLRYTSEFGCIFM